MQQSLEAYLMSQGRRLAHDSDQPGGCLEQLFPIPLRVSRLSTRIEPE